MVIEVNETALGNLRLTPAEALLHFAVGLYTAKHVTLAHAEALASVTRSDFQRQLGRRGIPVGYTADALRNDVENLQSVRDTKTKAPMKLRKICELGALLLICSFFFACSKQEDLPAIEHGSGGVFDSNAVAEVHFWIGGGTSTNLQSDPDFHRSVFNLYLFPGTNPVVKVDNANIDEFKVGAESSAGRAILRLIDKEKPWTWENPLGDMIPHADHLTVFGRAHGKKFNYDSVYPDPRLAILTRDLRKILAPDHTATAR